MPAWTRRDIIRSWRVLARMPALTLSPRFTAALVGVLLAAALVRGLDYMLLPQEPPEILSVVEAAAPIWVWGLGLVVGVLLAGTGWPSRFWPGAIVGHAVLAGIYAALAAGMVARGYTDIAGVGWRDGIDFGGVALVHVLLVVLAWREWDRARRP